MKKLFVTLLLLFCAPAYAELTKCVYLNPEMNCTAGRDLDTYDGKANWDATCTDVAGTTKITGVWGCGNQTAASKGATSDSLSSNYANSSDSQCWCKMLTPAVSMWVFHSRASSQGACHYTCGRLCLEALQEAGATKFKTNMFNTLGA